MYKRYKRDLPFCILRVEKIFIRLCTLAQKRVPDGIEYREKRCRDMEDTIAAVATAMAASGIGIVRISGSKSREIADRVYRSKGGKKKAEGPAFPHHTVRIYLSGRRGN